MNIKLLIPIILIVVLAIQVSALPSLTRLISSEKNPSNFCNTSFYNEKTFVANDTYINVGLVCSSDAVIHLYECVDATCKTKQNVEDGYKINNKFPKYTGFVTNKKYFYRCEECQRKLPKKEKVTLIKNNVNPLKSCDVQQGLTKKFKSNDAINNIGLVCKSNAKINLFECKDASCDAIKYIGTGYKNNNIFPLFKGFKLNNYYYYECLECKTSKKTTSTDIVIPKENKTEIVKETIIKEKSNPYIPNPILKIQNIKKNTLTIFEGKTARINATCINYDDRGSTVIEYVGWMNKSVKSTNYNDSGRYGVLVKCTGKDNKITIKKIIINVLDMNRPPQILWPY